MLTVEEWPIERLREYPGNPRKNDHAVAQMAGVMREFGFRIPIAAKSDGEVVDGHLRLKAARVLRLKMVPVLPADDLTEAQIKAFRIAVNRAATWAEWDFDLLKIELGALGDMGFDLGLTGFAAEEIGLILDPLGAGGQGQSIGSLAERFLVAPFSVLNAREGWWQERKRGWIALGIQSELGRGENALGFSETVLEPDPAKRAARFNATPGRNGSTTAGDMRDGTPVMRRTRAPAGHAPQAGVENKDLRGKALALHTTTDPYRG